MLAWQLCDFQGIRTSIAKKPYIFVIFSGGGVWTPCPPSGSAYVDDQFISENSIHPGAMPHFVACCLPKGLKFKRVTIPAIQSSKDL